MADPIVYVETQEPYDIAKPIIEQWHPHLIGFALRIVFRSQARKLGKGRGASEVVALGFAEIVRSRFAFFAMREEEVSMQQNHFEDPYRMFWMELAGDHWGSLTPEQKAALIDHELCHFGVEWPEEKDEPNLYIRRHDIEEFEEIVRRHGIWEGSLETFAAALMGFEGA